MTPPPRSLQTASKRIRYLGSAKSGVGAARAMHLTSVALIPLTIAFVWLVLSLVGQDYDGVRRTLGHPLPALVALVFVGVSIYHMALGMRVIIDDYVHDHHLKDLALTANLFFAWVIGLASIYSILKVGFSAA